MSVITAIIRSIPQQRSGESISFGASADYYDDVDRENHACTGCVQPRCCAAASSLKIRHVSGKGRTVRGNPRTSSARLGGARSVACSVPVNDKDNIQNFTENSTQITGRAEKRFGGKFVITAVWQIKSQLSSLLEQTRAGIQRDKICACPLLRRGRGQRVTTQAPRSGFPHTAARSHTTAMRYQTQHQHECLLTDSK